MMASSRESAAMRQRSQQPPFPQQQRQAPQPPPPPVFQPQQASLFDLFYEEFLTQLMNSGGNLAETLPEDFMKLQTDIDRVEYLINLKEFVRNFEISVKIGVKSHECSTRYREEGNKLFQADQPMQSILFYNKALCYAPHPDYEAYNDQKDRQSSAQQQHLHQHRSSVQAQVQFRDEPAGRQRSSVASGVTIVGKRPPPFKYEALSLCYANRSAALRKLGQYEDCLKDVARAAKFGYPRENIYKLWERKGKCYHGLKRFEMAVKCYRQVLQTLKDSTLSESQRGLKAHEIQTWIKEIRATNSFIQFSAEDAFSDMRAVTEDQPPMMGATGPIVIVPEPEPRQNRKMSAAVSDPAVGGSQPEQKQPSKPERMRSFRRKKTVKRADSSASAASAPASSPTPPMLHNNGASGAIKGGGDSASSSISSGESSLSRPNAMGELHKANSQMSISQLSTTGTKPDIEVPELSYGMNLRMPSASLAIDLRFATDKGRYFVATQDLCPGDVVLREEPYAAVLEAVFRVNHCAHCLKKIPNPIPCFECATVQYCSEACRELSWNEYHKIECGILAYLEPSRYLGKMPHLAMRIITKTGMQNLIQHSMAPILPTIKNGGQDHDQQPTFDPTSYRSVHNLATNTDKRPFEDLIKKTAIAIFMAKCLKFNGFFGSGSRDASQDTRRAEIFVSSLLLRHLQIASTNGLEMAECLLKNNDVTKFDIIPVGGAIFPTMSFFNHSCYPNAIRLGYQNFQVVRIIRSVARGEEINIDYGFDFYAQPIEARRKRATTQYFFACKCQACSKDWPTYTELATKRRVMKVKSVSQTMAEELERQAAAYQIGMDFLLKLDIPTAMPIFREYLMVMNKLIEHPDSRYIDCEEAYKQCLWLENRGYKAKLLSSPLTPTTPSSDHHARQTLV